MGKGTLSINLNPDPSFSEGTRSLNESNYMLTSEYTVQIINASNDNVLLECKAYELGSYLPKTFDIGSYKITATYGAEHDASRDEFFMSGSTVVTLKAKEEKSVVVNCSPTCGKVSVDFDQTMATYFDDYNVTFGGTKMLGSSTIAWSKTDVEPWYIALDKNGENINYTISLKAKEDYLTQGNGGTVANGSATGTFRLERNKAHKLTIRPSYTPTTDGGLQLGITIDESTNDKKITYEIPVTWL
ncbi:MAG: DUF4493 domain-containing protein [Bacteroidaceae bacterium]|nr:DUF4493 domain-containing protein [Bacteroidaceae bacterium]